jgi:hypothetical protein
VLGENIHSIKKKVLLVISKDIGLEVYVHVSGKNAGHHHNMKIGNKPF